MATKKTVKKPATKKVAVRAKSRATGKTPSARLKKPGYCPNPTSRAVVVQIGTKTWYLSGWTVKGPTFSPTAARAHKMDAKSATMMQAAIFCYRPAGVVSVDTVTVHGTKK